jgi:eukaryotic-like serine/threonine-protein kinase
MGEVVLTILGGLGCVAMMAVGMWLVPAFVRRNRFIQAGIARLRSRGTIDRILSWAEVERPDLRRASAPDGTTTLLFSDIENSSRLTERLGDQRWLEILNAHNAIVRAQVDEHGGYEVKSQGDGFMLAFPSARGAVRCAIDIQRALARRSANGEIPIRIRMGIHTGEAIQQQGDFYGKSVVCAARIADHAEGGEILVSSLVKELIEGRGDISLREIGEVELKGLADEQKLFKVVWAPPESELGIPLEAERLQQR